MSKPEAATVIVPSPSREAQMQALEAVKRYYLQELAKPAKNPTHPLFTDRADALASSFSR